MQNYEITIKIFIDDIVKHISKVYFTHLFRRRLNIKEKNAWNPNARILIFYDPWKCLASLQKFNLTRWFTPISSVKKIQSILLFMFKTKSLVLLVF